MAFWKRKKSPEEIAEQMNQDGDKAEWLQKVLSPEEFTDFNLAQETSIVFATLLDYKEPKKGRSSEIRKLMQDFLLEIKRIIDHRPHAQISERDQQVEELIQNAKFSDNFKFAPLIYYYFRSLTDEERKEWAKKSRSIYQEMFPFSLFDQ